MKKTLESYKERLNILQRTLRDQNVPVIIVTEGWNAAGITMGIHEIVQALDPRGFALHAIDSPTAEERARPFLWRFWLRRPPREDRPLCPELVQPCFCGIHADTIMGESPREQRRPDQPVRAPALR